VKPTFKQFIKAIRIANHERNKPLVRHNNGHAFNFEQILPYKKAHETIYAFSPWLYKRLWRWI
jgi:hypothetical protein